MDARNSIAVRVGAARVFDADRSLDPVAQSIAVRVRVERVDLAVTVCSKESADFERIGEYVLF